FDVDRVQRERVGDAGSGRVLETDVSSSVCFQEAVHSCCRNDSPEDAVRAGADHEVPERVAFLDYQFSKGYTRGVAEPQPVLAVVQEPVLVLQTPLAVLGVEHHQVLSRGVHAGVGTRSLYAEAWGMVAAAGHGIKQRLECSNQTGRKSAWTPPRQALEA